LDRANYLVGTGEAAGHLGAAFNVVPDVHVADPAFRELVEAQGGDAASALGHYLHEGRVDAEFVRDVISDVQGAPVYDGRVVAPMTILDFDAGYGRVARHLKNVVPNAKVVALDWAQVLEVAKENAQKSGVADRFKTLPGSAFEVEYGSDYDLVLLTKNPIDAIENTRSIELVIQNGAVVFSGARVTSPAPVGDANRG